MWEVSYRMTPDRGYFDSGEQYLWDAGLYLQSIQSIEFVEDGSVVIVYEVEGDPDVLREVLDAAPEKIIDYSIGQESEPVVAQLWFYPDETLEALFDVHRSFGVSMQFPLQYVSHDPASVEIVETGPREQLRDRIERTREHATVHINHVHRHEPGTHQLFSTLTDRQQEVLRTAAELGYYRIPRQTTQQEIADELGCSKSVVGQHLRRIEATLVTAAIPEPVDGEL